ncbi:MAG: phage tail protein [Saprospiraceae bacterium]|nr:phage tail protein [Saprospiraceae bacterium]
MATNRDTIKGSYPLPVYNYRVEIDGRSIAFSEVSGLSMAFETKTYKESPTDGTQAPRVMQMPMQATPPTITLKRGIVRGGERLMELYNWLKSIQSNVVDKKDITISLCDETGTPVIQWLVMDAFPKKLDAPSFTAESNDAAIESMELVADRIMISAAS